MRQIRADEHGKIAEAWWVTSQFADEIEADLQRYYGMDFVDLFLPGRSLTWRKLLVLLHHLPPESAVNTAIRNQMPDSVMARGKGNPSMSRWSSLEMLTAVLIDEIRQFEWAFIQSRTDRKIPRPLPIPRPGLPTRPERAIPLAVAQRMDPRLRGLSDEDAQVVLDRVTGRRNPSKRGDKLWLARYL